MHLCKVASSYHTVSKTNTLITHCIWFISSYTLQIQEKCLNRLYTVVYIENRCSDVENLPSPKTHTIYLGFKEIHCKPQRKTRCQLRNVSRNQRNLESWMILFASRKCSSRLVCLGWGEKHRPLVRCISCRMPCSQNAKHSHH